MTAITISNNKFTSTRCNVAPKARVHRSDIGPIETQYDAVAFQTKELKKQHHRFEQRQQNRSKDDHVAMLLMLLGEANHHHRYTTKQFVCKINQEVVTNAPAHQAGLSKATLKALVTDVDIVMTDDDKDNYQHALGAIAALSLWQ